ncbi:MAG: hypothetical protein QXT50_01215 [Thermofilum sp.]
MPLFYKGELVELLVAVTAVFAVFAGSFAWSLTPVSAAKLFLLAFGIYAPHELAHKFVAEYYGFPARFQISPMLLALTLISAIPYMPLKFIVPGAVRVYVHSGYSRSIDGKISAAGPLVSVALGFVALLSGLKWLAMFSGWISLFNLLPLGPLDGRKVLFWSPPFWALLMGASLFLLLLS